MGLTLPLALLLTLGVIGVVIAHSLRKGQATPLLFPAARLIVQNEASARKRQRVEDRGLLALRALTIFALALLAASPFVSCSRLTLARKQGASVSAVIVIDDSASMQAKNNGKTRLFRAKEAARQLLADAQSGDAFSIVLSGSPARVHVPATSDLVSLKSALATIEATDRKTDLAGALTLARGIQSQAAQQDHPIIVLSDLALIEGSTLDLSDVAIPDIGITKPLSNCALVQASQGQNSVLAEVICTDKGAIENRTVRLADRSGKSIGQAVAAHDGVVTLPQPDWAKNKPDASEVLVQLSASDSDQIESDDQTFLLGAGTQLSFGVRADQAKASVKTGSDTVLQSGLEALERGIRVRPLSLLPEEVSELDDLAGLLIDDPSGFSPEVRKTIETWVKQGGVAAVFLGPSINRAPLGSNFAPFLLSAPQWIKETPPGTSETQAGGLGPLTVSWHDLHARGRAVFSPDPEMTVLSSWVDGTTLVSSREFGQGLLVVSALPSSVDLSDFALRPAYLELLEFIVSQAHVRRGAAATQVGQRWKIPEGSVVSDQSGRRLELTTQTTDTRASNKQFGRANPQWMVDPDRAGRYSISSQGQSSYRYATRVPEEHIAQSRNDLASDRQEEKTNTESKVGISREIALVVLVLSLLELALRLIRREKTTLWADALRRPSSSTKVSTS